MEYKMFDKVFCKYDKNIGQIDAITNSQVRVYTKEKGYLWMGYREIEPYKNQTTAPTKPTPDGGGFICLWHNQPLYERKVVSKWVKKW